jgi:capsular polysaccharide biosynthesis protein
MKELLKALRPGTVRADVPAGDASSDVEALREELAGTRRVLEALKAQAAQASSEVEHLLALERGRLLERASLTALPRPRLLSTSIDLQGSASERLRVRRLTVGDPVERPFSRSFGVTRCVTEAADVRELWERLLGFEKSCEGDVLRGRAATVLDVPGATASLAEDGSLRIAIDGTAPQGGTVAIPRFTYDAAARKLNNFGHWLLDCLPQVAVLATVAPDAAVLMPPQQKRFHGATLSLLGIDADRVIAWDGSPVECGRLLAFENDGRGGGGRPFSPLMELRRLLGVDNGPPAGRGDRLLYVSRRDAPKNRRWMSNEPEVEELFRSRGFDVRVMADCPLDEQVRLFREARIVAGGSGAGLSDVVFSPRGTHVVVLLSDPLIRWYAREEGTRSLWATGRRQQGAQLAALGDSPRFYAHLTAGLEQTCHSFVAGEQMPLEPLARFLDDVLAEVDRA